MAAARKFLFSTVFDNEPAAFPEVAEAEVAAAPPEAEAAAPPPPPPTFSEAELAAARDEAFAAGREDGIRQAAEAVGQQIADTLLRLMEHLDQLFARQASAAEVAATEAAAVAVAITRKVLPVLAGRGAVEEVSGLIGQAMELARDEPRVIIRVAESLREPLAGHIQALTEGRGFRGEVVLTGDPAMAPGDCAVDWSAGGAERDSAALWRQIDAIVERNLNTVPAPRGEPAAS